jgi:hypothetical protein
MLKAHRLVVGNLGHQHAKGSHLLIYHVLRWRDKRFAKVFFGGKTEIACNLVFSVDCFREIFLGCMKVD